LGVAATLVKFWTDPGPCRYNPFMSYLMHDCKLRPKPKNFPDGLVVVKQKTDQPEGHTELTVGSG
jgi:hypothetical protein